MLNPIQFNNDNNEDEIILSESDKDLIKQYLDKGELISYGSKTNKKGTVITLQIKL